MKISVHAGQFHVKMKCAPHTVSISEEANTSDHNQPGMIPSEWSFIDFREGHPSPLVRVHNVRIDSRNISIGRIPDALKAQHGEEVSSSWIVV